MGIFLVISGILGIIGGIVGETFYKVDVIALETFKSKEKWTPWFGRLICIVAGVILIAVGIKLLVEAE